MKVVFSSSGGVYLHLFVPEIGFYETKELMARRHLQQLINPRNGITISWASLIQAGEVNVDSPLFILLLYEDGTGEPVRVERLSYEASLK